MSRTLKNILMTSVILLASHLMAKEPHPMLSNRVQTLTTADINGDGLEDRLIGLDDRTRLVWWSKAEQDRIWTQREIGGPFETIFSVLPTDMDGDLDTDILAIVDHGGRVVWFENLDGDGQRWQRRLIREDLHFDHGLAQLYTADVDLDGNLEVLAEIEGRDDVLMFAGGKEDMGWWELEYPDSLADVSDLNQAAPADIQSKVACAVRPYVQMSWWPLDEYLGPVVKDVVDTHNGARYGATINTLGKVDSGYYFDGVNDYINVPDHPDLDADTGDFSITAWIRIGSSPVKPVIVTKRTSSFDKGFKFMLWNGKLLLQMNDGVNGFYNFISTSSNVLTDNQWHHVAVSVDRSSTSGGKFYIDGVLDHTFNPTIRPYSLSTSASFRIGKEDDIGHYFKGYMDEVTFYKSALSASRIVGEFQAGSYGKCKQEPLEVAIECTEYSSAQECEALTNLGSGSISFSWSITGPGSIASSGDFVYVTYTSGCYTSGGTLSVTATDSVSSATAQKYLNCLSCTGFSCFQ